MKVIPHNSAAIPGSHTITFRTRDAHRDFPVREVEVLASKDEIDAIARDGYLVRDNLISMEQVVRLREALDATMAAEEQSGLETKGGRAFGGVFIRHLMDKHPTFLELLHFQPTLSIARALFGPAIQWRGLTGRVCYPTDPNKETEWHFHQRVVPDPIPPLFSRPQTIDVLLYLDEIDDRNGPLCVVPGSHNWMDKDLDTNGFDEIENQIVLRLPAGSAVLAHGSLWHRALPTQPGCTIRRLLLWGYGPAWQKPAIYGVKPVNGLTNQLLSTPGIDEETKELLGVAGYM
jgi:ectoine hydroxylase-related dioxygenase (phytanoyl-CoA dioxygenase family)